MLQNSPVFQEHNNGESVFSHRAAASPHLHWENRERKKKYIFCEIHCFLSFILLGRKMFSSTADVPCSQVWWWQRTAMSMLNVQH